jgi:hypothetical protein
MENKIELTALTAEQKAQLFSEMKAEEQKKEQAKVEERKTLKKLSSETVDSLFDGIKCVSEQMSEAKTIVFDSFAHLIELKCELYNVKDDQQSHTFSNEEGTRRITLGWRALDRYDETSEIGISKVREYIDSLAIDEKTAELVKGLNSLLRRDAKNNLKSNRVLELQKWASESDSDLLKEGVKIIVDSYKPQRSSYFIEAEEFESESQKWVSIPLSISAVDFVTNTTK